MRKYGDVFSKFLYGVVALAASAVPAAAQQGPLTLEECVAMALQSNLQIEAAVEKLTEKDAAIGEAETSRLPKLSGQASYTRAIPQPKANVPIGADLSQAPNYGGMFAPIMMKEFKASGNIYNAGLNLTQPLYTGGKITNAKKIAEQSREMADWQRKSVVREVRRDVTKAYYNALAANRSIVALDSAISMMEVMIRDLGNAVEVGMRGEHELLQAQVQLLNQRLARQQAATGAQAAHDYLSTLIGVPVNTPITLVEDMDAPESLNLAELAALQTKARGASTDLKALDEQLKIIETSLLITDASNLPMLVAAAGYSGQGMGGFGKDFDWTNSGTLSLVLQWDIYDGNSVNHKRKQTLSQKRQLELNMDYLRVNLDMLVKNNCASLRDAFAGIETGRKSIEQTQKSYEISYDNFQMGKLLSSELLNVQNLRLQAEISYYVALSNFYVKRAELDYLVNDER
jgi:outer membrane protein TolC